MKKVAFLLLSLLSTGGMTTWAQDDSRLSFGVISDIHFGSNVGEGSMVKVPQALKHLTSHGKLDALVMVGDLTNGGQASQYEKLVQVFTDEQTFTNPVGEFLFLMGNHDNYDGNGRRNYQNGLKVFNGGEPYPFHAYHVIKGYPFITVSMFDGSNSDIHNPSNGNAAYPQATVEWLREHMEMASKECPGKPIFVFAHVPPRWTCYSAWAEYENGEAWCMKVLNPVLNQYPQAVVFGGHSHYPVGDPRSIHQGVNPQSERQNFYTVINTGTTDYSEINPGAVDAGIHPYMYDHVTEGLILNELENGDIEVRRYDTYRNEEISADQRWLLKAPFDGSMFQYGDIRDADDNPLGYELRNGLPAPDFNDDARLTVTPGAYDAAVSFPQATDNECVFRYELSVKKANPELVVSKSLVFSLFYLNSEMPETLECKVGDLEPETEYVMEVTAYDSYDNASEKISATFTTTADDDPANEVPTPYERWRFDDGSTPFASEIGNASLVPLTVTGDGKITVQPDASAAGIIPTTGPSDSDNALLIPADAGLKMEFQMGSSSRNYTLQMDVRVKNARPFNALFQTNLNNSDDADCFISDNKLGVGTLGYGGSIQDNTWHRLIFVNRKGEFSAYIDGKLVKTATDSRWNINRNGVLLFVDNDGERTETEVAEVAFWKEPLTEGQIHRLGKIASNEYLQLLTTKVRLVDRRDFTIKVNTNARVIFKLPDWIEAIDADPTLGVKEYSFRAKPMEQPGRRTATISVETANIAAKAVEVTQISVGESMPQPCGMWTFDNPDELLAGSGISSLYGAKKTQNGVSRTSTLEEAGITPLTEGPAEGNGAISVPKDSYLWMTTNAGTDILSDYTIMVDIRPETLDGFNAIYNNRGDISHDGAIFIKNGQIGYNDKGLGYNGKLIPSKWHRVVMVLRDSYIHIYIDGKKVGQSNAPFEEHWALHPDMLFFADDNGEEVRTDVAEIRFWDVPLTDKHVAELGNVDSASGILSVTEAEPSTEAIVYDLFGRRVAHPGKGIYIVNGRKVALR